MSMLPGRFFVMGGSMVMLVAVHIFMLPLIIKQNQSKSDLTIS
ncbi:hypothetical protein [Bacillus sp. NEB1478]|nr:hypothetical protein [Bacillus sp. NEB1478]WNB90724.1 hypothetical protein RGB74_12455 [Bacillus sp. NEB1478]